MSKVDTVDLSVVLGKIKLKNPVMPASGTFGYGAEFADFIDLRDLGAVVVKGTSLKPQLGNFERRFIEIAGCASVFTIGLQNVGVEVFVKEKLPYLYELGTPVVVNITGETLEDFVKVTEILNNAVGVSAIEVNLQCPNVKKGGVQFSADPDTAFGIVRAIRQATNLTVIPKFVPRTIGVADFARGLEQAGADALLPNFNVTGMAIDINRRCSQLGKNLEGSIGGPWRKPIGVKLVWQAAQAVKIPIVGGGGIAGAEDALEFLIAGATAIEIGTYNLIDPRVTIKTIEGLKKYLIDKGIKRIRDVIGTLVVDC